MRDVLAGLRPTRRGVGLIGTGILVTAIGTALGVSTMVTLGLVLLLTVAVGLVALVAELSRLRHGRLRISRTIRPHPLSVGEEATVRVEVVATRGSGLDRMEISERAARELSTGDAPRARVARAPRRLELSYPITGTRRGRWRTGPLEVRRTDLVGAVRWRGPAGDASSVAVRPRLVPLPAPRSGAALDARAAAGTRTAAPDDAALREYRPGDDLRRVHWASSARLGDLLVRQDEHSGRRPATVLLDLPVDDEPLEWTISTGVSVAAALLAAGHPVRVVVAGSGEPYRAPGATGLEEILDAAVDYAAPPDRVTGRTWFMAGLETLALFGAGRELVVGVLGAMDRRTLADLARLGDVHESWALVRSTAAPSPVEVATVETLRRGGWTAVHADTRSEPTVAWSALLDLHEATVADR